MSAFPAQLLQTAARALACAAHWAFGLPKAPPPALPVTLANTAPPQAPPPPPPVYPVQLIAFVPLQLLYFLLLVLLASTAAMALARAAPLAATLPQAPSLACPVQPTRTVSPPGPQLLPAALRAVPASFLVPLLLCAAQLALMQHLQLAYARPALQASGVARLAPLLPLPAFLVQQARGPPSQASLLKASVPIAMLGTTVASMPQRRLPALLTHSTPHLTRAP